MTEKYKSDSQVSRIKELIQQDIPVVASLDSTYLGAMQYQTTDQVKHALLRLGFKEVRETAEGALAVLRQHRRMLEGQYNKNIIYTGCPGINDFIERYYPDLIPYMSPVVSPGIAHGKIIKKQWGGQVKVVYVGPCEFARSESEDFRHREVIDGVLNFKQLESWMKKEEIRIEECAEHMEAAQPQETVHQYALSGGCLKWLCDNSQDSYDKFRVDGLESCIEVCEGLRSGEFNHCFIEMNLCQGGCVGGPGFGTDKSSYLQRLVQMEKQLKKECPASGQEFLHLGDVDFEKTFGRTHLKSASLTNDFAVWDRGSIYGFPRSAERRESLSEVIIESSPNIILIVDRDMNIREYSFAGERYFGKTRQEACSMKLDELFDSWEVRQVFATGTCVSGKKVLFETYQFTALEHLTYIRERDMVLITLIDITKQEEEKQLEFEKRLETIDLAQKVIHKQMMVAQEIAGLLGETTAETKTTLTKLCRSLLDEGSKGGDGIWN